MDDQIINKDGIFIVENENLMDLKIPDVITYVEDLFALIDFSTNKENNRYSLTRLNLLK